MTAQEHSLPELIRKAIEAGAADLHVSAIGTIHQWDAATQRAQVKLVTKRPIDSEADGVAFEELPILQDVPVMFPRSASASMTWELAPGDGVLVHFLDYDSAGWLATGQGGNAGQTRSHSLGYAVAFAGLGPLSAPLPGAALPALVLDHTSSILLGGAAATMFVALSTLVETRFTELLTALQAATPTPNDGGAGLRTTWLAALVIAGWTGGGLIPPSVAATKTKAQ